MDLYKLAIISLLIEQIILIISSSKSRHEQSKGKSGEVGVHTPILSILATITLIYALFFCSTKNCFPVKILLFAIIVFKLWTLPMMIAALESLKMGKFNRDKVETFLFIINYFFNTVLTVYVLAYE